MTSIDQSEDSTHLEVVDPGRLDLVKQLLCVDDILLSHTRVRPDMFDQTSPRVEDVSRRRDELIFVPFSFTLSELPAGGQKIGLGPAVAGEGLPEPVDVCLAVVVLHHEVERLQLCVEHHPSRVKQLRPVGRVTVHCLEEPTGGEKSRPVLPVLGIGLLDLRKKYLLVLKKLR